MRSAWRPEAPGETAVDRNTFVAMLASLLVGGVGGYFFGHSSGMREALNRGQGVPMYGVPPPAAPVAAPAAAAPAPGGVPSGALLTPELAQRIEVNRKLVQKDPKNREAWVQLGNDYFDTQQRQKSIEAYARALELRGDDPNVLTDQGVMFRETGAFDQAIANFQKANKVDPKHVQSLFNLGVVYASDKRDADRAAAAWRKVIEVAPASPQAEQARKALTELGGAAGLPAARK